MNRPEPAVIAAAFKEALSSILKLLVIFAVINITTEQFGALMIAVDAILAAFMVVFIRQNVTPVSSPQVPAGTIVQVSATDGTVTETEV